MSPRSYRFEVATDVVQTVVRALLQAHNALATMPALRPVTAICDRVVAVPFRIVRLPAGLERRFDPLLGASWGRALWSPLVILLMAYFARLGLIASTYGHMETTPGLFQALPLVSGINPYLGALGAITYAVFDWVNKLLGMESVYGADWSNGFQNWAGARVGYIIAYSAPLLMGVLPGVVARLCGQIAGRTVGKMMRVPAGATAALLLVGGGAAALWILGFEGTVLMAVGFALLSAAQATPTGSGTTGLLQTVLPAVAGGIGGAATAYGVMDYTSRVANYYAFEAFRAAPDLSCRAASTGNLVTQTPTTTAGGGGGGILGAITNQTIAGFISPAPSVPIPPGSPVTTQAGGGGGGLLGPTPSNEPTPATLGEATSTSDPSATSTGGGGLPAGPTSFIPGGLPGAPPPDKPGGGGGTASGPDKQDGTDTWGHCPKCGMSMPMKETCPRCSATPVSHLEPRPTDPDPQGNDRVCPVCGRRWKSADSPTCPDTRFHPPSSSPGGAGGGVGGGGGAQPPWPPPPDAKPDPGEGMRWCPNGVHRLTKNDPIGSCYYCEVAPPPTPPTPPQDAKPDPGKDMRWCPNGVHRLTKNDPIGSCYYCEVAPPPQPPKPPDEPKPDPGKDMKWCPKNRHRMRNNETDCWMCAQEGSGTDTTTPPPGQTTTPPVQPPTTPPTPPAQPPTPPDPPPSTTPPAAPPIAPPAQPPATPPTAPAAPQSAKDEPVPAFVEDEEKAIATQMAAWDMWDAVLTTQQHVDGKKPPASPPAAPPTTQAQGALGLLQRVQDRDGVNVPRPDVLIDISRKLAAVERDPSVSEAHREGYRTEAAKRVAKETGLNAANAEVLLNAIRNYDNEDPRLKQE